jgi:hypothetical protein
MTVPQNHVTSQVAENNAHFGLKNIPFASNESLRIEKKPFHSCRLSQIRSAQLSSAPIRLIWQYAPVIRNLRIELPSQYEVLKNALFRAVSVLRSILKANRLVVKRLKCWIQLKCQKSQEFNASVISRDTLLCCEAFDITRSRVKSFP